MRAPFMNVRLAYILFAIFGLSVNSALLHSQDRAGPKPEKYALIVGVTDYAKPELNTGLMYPEKDASALRDVLKDSGFAVDLLLGEQATKLAIETKLQNFSKKGANQGVVFVALCGHGTEFAESKKSYFCPYDTAMKAARDKANKPLYDDRGMPRMSFVEDSMIAIDDVLLALGESMAAHRVLVADCCRDDPNRARGRSFGSSLTTDRLPIQTLLLLGCSSQEKSLEHDNWGHGALTKCLLDQLRSSRLTSRTMGSIAEDVIPAVKSLVAGIPGSHKQTPRMLSTGRVELLLAGTTKDFSAELKQLREVVFRRQSRTGEIAKLVTNLRIKGCSEPELDFIECTFACKERSGNDLKRAAAIRDRLITNHAGSYFANAAKIYWEVKDKQKNSSSLKLHGTNLVAQVEELIRQDATYEYTLQAAGQILSWSDSPNKQRYGELLDDLIVKAPWSPFVWLEKGNDLQDFDPSGALKYFAKAIELDPEYSVAFNVRGHCLIQLERHEEAIQDFDRAIAIERGGYTNAHMQKSRAQLALGLKSDSRETLEECLKNCELTYFDLIYAGGQYAELESNSEAIKTLEKAIAMDQGEIRAYEAMLSVLIQGEKYTEAKRTLKRAEENCGKFESLLLRSKTHLYSLGLRTAWDGIREVRNLRPENEDAINFDLILSALVGDRSRSLKCMQLAAASNPRLEEIESVLKSSWTQNQKKVKIKVPQGQSGALYVLTGTQPLKVDAGSSIELVPGLFVEDFLRKRTGGDDKALPRKAICYFTGDKTKFGEEMWSLVFLENEDEVTFVYESKDGTGKWRVKK